MKVFVSIFFGAAVILTAYSNIGAWQSAIVLWKYGSRWPVVSVALMTLLTLFAWAATSSSITYFSFLLFYPLYTLPLASPRGLCSSFSAGRP